MMDNNEVFAMVTGHTVSLAASTPEGGYVFISHRRIDAGLWDWLREQAKQYNITNIDTDRETIG